MTEWSQIHDIEKAKEKICTGYPKKSFVSDLSLRMVNLTQKCSILDFGCGIGRNLSYILSKAPDAKIFAYDYPNMIDLARQYLGALSKRVSWFNPPLENLAELSFDLIVAILVFQHMPPDELDSALKFLAGRLQVSGELLVSSRGYLDLNGNIWPIILRYFEPTTSLDPSDGTERHQAALFRLRSNGISNLP